MIGIAGRTFEHPPDESSNSPTPWIWLALVTATAALLRARGLNDALWTDEIRTLVDSVRLPLSRIVTTFPGDNQHTLYSVLAHVSVGVFGEHPWSLRLPAMFFGILSVPMLYVFACELVPRTEALLASLLLAVSYHHVWFSQNARGYSTLAFLALLSSWFVLRGLRRGRASDWVAYAVVMSLGVYTHLTMVLLAPGQALLCVGELGFQRGPEQLRRWRLPLFGFALAGIFSALLYAPVLFAVREAMLAEAAPTAVVTPGWAATELLRGLQIGFGSAFGVLVGVTLVLAGLPSYFKHRSSALGLFLLPGLMIAAASVALHRPVRPRFFFFLAPFALLVAVRGALEIGRVIGGGEAGGRARGLSWGMALVGVLAVLSVSAIAIESGHPKQDFEGAMRYVEANRAEDALVVTAGGARYPYQVYYQLSWQPIASVSDLDAARSRGRPIWVVLAMKPYVAADLMRALDEGCKNAKVFPGTVAGGEVTVCTMAPASAPAR